MTVHGESAGMGGRVAGILLAAGASVRFGSEPPKQLARLAGEPLVRRVARQALASGLDELIVVVGHAARSVREAVDGLTLTVVDNPDWRCGQSTSVVAGLRSVPADCVAAAFLVADQPFLGAAVLDPLLAAFTASGGPIVVPTLRRRRSAPVIFARSLFPELLALQGDVGGRQLFPRHADEIIEVEFTTERAFEDIDTREDLIRLSSTLDG